MKRPLTDHEVRVLGSLLEKEMATPDYYPLTLNGLLNACNQKSSRDPVVCLDKETLLSALNGLKESGITRQSDIGSVPRYEQIFSNNLKLVPGEKAALCILLLRGPQTLGEIRSRTARLYSFTGLDEVQETMISLEDIKLVKKLPRQPGRKESRNTHLLSGEPDDNPAVETDSRQATNTVIPRQEQERSAEQQEQIDGLRRDLESLKLEFETFKAQFE